MKEREIDREPIGSEHIDDNNQFGSDCRIEGEGEADADNVTQTTPEDGDNSSIMAEPQTDWQDKYFRLSAEFDNYRKRTIREKMELMSMGGEDVVGAFLPVADDFDRALVAMERSVDMGAVVEGLSLIHKKFFDTLKSKGVDEIDSLGEDLNTDLHEAVAQFPVEDKKKKGKIIDVAQKGYKYKDKVIRHAKVVVGE